MFGRLLIGVSMSLLRNLFWVGVLMLTLAVAPDIGFLGPAAERGRERAGLEDVFFIVSATVSDMGEICDRRPEVCDKLDLISHQFRNRAVRITEAAHDWLTDGGDGEDPPVYARMRSRNELRPPPGRQAGDGWYLAETPPEQRE